MQAKPKDYSKKARGQHKIRGKVGNKKKGVLPQSLKRNTMTPRDNPNKADIDLGNLLSR